MRARSWIATLSGATLIATAALVGSTTLTSANAADQATTPEGTLTLTTVTTATGDQWSYDKSAVTQPFTGAAKTCLLTTPASPFVTLAGSYGTAAAAAAVGFASHSIGVITPGAPSSQCNKVAKSTNETLTVALNNGTGGGLVDPTFGKLYASSATLDVETKENSRVTAQLIRGGVVVDTYYLWVGDGDNDSDDPAPTTPLDHTYQCVVADGVTDVGGKRDNCYWPIASAIPVPGGGFDTLKLTPTAGQFSLEGGADWGTAATTHRTVFPLVAFVDGIAPCDSTVSKTSLSSGISGVTLNRLADGAPSTDTCTGLAYDLAVDGTVTLHKSYSAAPSAQFTLATERILTPGQEIPALTGDWEQASGPAPYKLPYCQGPAFISQPFANYDPITNGGVFAYGSGSDAKGPKFSLPDWTALNVAANHYDAVPTAAAPGVQYACIYAETSEIKTTAGGTQQLVYDFIYLTGDFKLGL